MTDVGGKTPLDLAVEEGHTEVVQSLRKPEPGSVYCANTCVPVSFASRVN